MKRTNVRREGRRRAGETPKKKGTESTFNKMTEKKSRKNEMSLKIQEIYRTPSRVDQKRISPQYIITKTFKVQNKESGLKAARKKQKTFQ